MEINTGNLRLNRLDSKIESAYYSNGDILIFLNKQYKA